MSDDAEKQEQSLADLIREKHAQVKAGDFFALLGVDRTSDSGAIRTAYFNLARMLHPDALGRQGLREYQREAIEVFKAISEAYHTLSDRRKRVDYETKLAQPREAAAAADRPARDREQEARIYFHKGSLLLQRRAWSEAAACFKKANELDPTSPRFMVYLGWATMQNTALPERPRIDEAKLWFDRALAQAGTDAEPYYFLSLYYKAIGDATHQRKMLDECLLLNGKHVDAQRESRLLAMRTKKSTASPIVGQVKNLLSRFVQKK